MLQQTTLMKKDSFVNVLENWKESGVTLDDSIHPRVLRLLYKISATMRRFPVNQQTDDETDNNIISRISEEWILKSALEGINSYAQKKRSDSFIELLQKSESKGANYDIIKHLQSALSALRETHNKAGIYPRDALLSEVLFSNSLKSVVDITLDNAASPEKIDILIGKEYKKIICEYFRDAEDSICIAVSSLTLPKNKHHPMHSLFSTINSTMQKGIKLTVFLSTDCHFINGSTSINNDTVFRWFSERGANVILLHPAIKYHANAVIIDNKITIIGSHRWSGKGIKSDNESSVAITSHQFSIETKTLLMGAARKGFSYSELGLN